MINVKKLFLVLVVVIGLALAVILPHNASQPLTPQIVYAAAKTCPDIVKSALQTVDNRCSSTGRNSLCYGNVQVQVTPQANAPKFTFAKPGDKTQLQNIESLQLSSLSADANDWGIAVMRVQANLPDTAPGQNVTMLLFGNVQISDSSKTDVYPTDEPTIVVSPPAPLPTVTPTLGGSSNNKPVPTVRPTSTPKPTSTPIATTPPVFKSMQAFYFSSGVGEPSCNEAPEDGILIQAPQNGQQITLVINDVRVDIHSTVFFQAQAGKEMIISTLEGSAVISAFGQISVAGVGARVRVPIDANLKASGPPSQPEPFDANAMKVLPAQHLPIKVTPAAPIPTLASGLRYTTWRWTFSASVVSGPCIGVPGNSYYQTWPIDVNGALHVAGNKSDGPYLSITRDFNETVDDGSITQVHYEFHQTSPTHGEGFQTGSNKKSGCSVIQAMRADLVSGVSPTITSTAAATAAQ